MEALEEIDLVRHLNFSSSCNFLRLAEEDLAGVVMAANERKKPCRVVFPPLKPRYATLLQSAVARFLAVKVLPQGWGDERCWVVDATAQSALPALRCSDFRQLGAGAPAKRLREAVEASPEKPAQEAASPSRDAQGGDAATVSDAAPGVKAEGDVMQHDDRCSRTEDARASKRHRGMAAWDDEEDEDDSWIARRRKQSAASGHVLRGRGFAEATAREGGAGGERGARGAPAPTGAREDDEEVHCALQHDYTKYAIDPEDTYRPHRKPYGEIEKDWELSNAWQFEPDQQESLEEARRRAPSDVHKGVVTFKVEHDKGGDFCVAFVEGSSLPQARALLEGRARKGEEPFAIEFRLLVSEKAWEYRVGRLSSLQAWKRIPWSSPNRTTFWAATYPGTDGKQFLLAGLDEFPERRFMCAKVRFSPNVVALGPTKERRPDAQPFYVRDVAVYGRASLLEPPFATRDHFVELRGWRSVAEARKAAEAALEDKASLLWVDSCGPACPDKGEVATKDAPDAPDTSCDVIALAACRSEAAARALSEALGPRAALQVRSSEWVWPPSPEALKAAGGDGPAAAAAHKEASRECWRQLHGETARELALFEETTERRTKHLEGTRMARTAATRMILSNLKGDAPRPRPPQVVNG